MIQAHDDCLTAAINVKIAHGITKTALHPQAAKDALKIRIAIDCNRLICRPAHRTPNEGGDRCRDSRYGANSAWDFFNVNAGVRKSRRHGEFSVLYIYELG